MLSRAAGFLRSRSGVVASAIAGLIALIAVVVLALSSTRDDPIAFTAQPTPSLSPTPTASPTASPTPSPSPTVEPSLSPEAACPFDGVGGSAAALAEPVLISIDNAPQARPATGLNAADIVFENPVQGNSTRFVALFACNSDVQAVGPVRSGRWIQVDLWHQLRALPIIYGAAGYTTSYFAGEAMPYIDGNVEPWAFFSRSASRPAPYNVYLDMPRLQELLESNADLAGRAAAAGNPRPLFTFDVDWVAPEGAREVSALTIRTASFWAFGWQYDAASNMYERIDAGVLTTDAVSDQPLTRRTIVVQRAVSERTFADANASADPPLQDLVGSGTGVIYVDGVAFDVLWTRRTEDDVTEWTITETGEPLVLPPGPIWWEIVPTTASVVESSGP